jgi:thioredoxin-dependent peroxiredoxin
MPEIGENAPDFELADDEGNEVRLSDFRGKRVLLYFYPQDFTSGCELQACSLRDSYPEIQARNGLVLGVSPDSVESHRKFREALELPFHLLSDPDLQVSREWNSIRTTDKSDGTTSEGVRRGQYVIDEQGKIIDVQTPVQASQSRKLALEKL